MNVFRAIKRFFHRPPDFYIGGADNPYMRRWWVIPRNAVFNIYLHNMLRSDDYRALHDHPWSWCSILLLGAYREVTELVDNKDYSFDETRSSVDVFNTRESDEILVHYLGHVSDPYVKVTRSRVYSAPSIRFRKPTDAHRLELIGGRPVWTLFLTGRWRRVWGFWCKRGWIPWMEFVAENNKGNVGVGCGEHDDYES